LRSLSELLSEQIEEAKDENVEFYKGLYKKGDKRLKSLKVYEDNPAKQFKVSI
jgi:hypothetical protein